MFVNFVVYQKILCNPFVFCVLMLIFPVYIMLAFWIIKSNKNLEKECVFVKLFVLQ